MNYRYEKKTFFNDLVRSFPAAKLDLALATLADSFSGGPIDAIVFVETIDEIKRATDLAARYGVPYCVVATSSSTVFSEIGFPGLVIINKLKSIVWDDDRSQVIAGSALDLAGLVNLAAARGLGGLESFSVVPGSVAGAFLTKAVSAGTALVDLVKEVTVYHPKGRDDQTEVISDRLSFDRLIKRSKDSPTDSPVVLAMKIQLRRLAHREIIRRIHCFRRSVDVRKVRYGYLWEEDLGDLRDLVLRASKIGGRQIGLNRDNPNLVSCRDEVSPSRLYNWVTAVEQEASDLGIALTRKFRFLGHWLEKEEDTQR